MPAESHQAVEQLVIAFPSAAAWVIVILLTIIALGAAWMGRKFLSRMDDQDTTLLAIKDLLASEVGKLREMHHAMDRRVVWIEAQLGRRDGAQYGRRATDEQGPACE